MDFGRARRDGGENPNAQACDVNGETGDGAQTTDGGATAREAADWAWAFLGRGQSARGELRGFPSPLARPSQMGFPGDIPAEPRRPYPCDRLLNSAQRVRWWR